MPLGIRALMIDAPRLQETDRYYRRLIRFAADWGANAIVFRVTDDQGIAMRLRALPLAKRPHQYSKKGMRDLVNYARRHGVTLIPEVECLGHSRVITSHPGYEDIRESPGKHGFQGICLSRRKTYDLLADIIEEVCEVFDSEYIHLGCDEAVFGVCPRCRAKAQKTSKHVVYAKHIARLNRVVKSLGRRSIIWADHTVDLWGNGRLYERKAARMIPRDVIMANWEYRHTVTEVSTSELVGEGFQVLTCPALHWCRASVFPSNLELTNVKRFVAQAHRYSDRGAVGSIVTIWCPYRLITDAMWHSIAMAATMMRQRRFDKKRFDRDFASRFYGLTDGAKLADAYDNLYSAGLGLQKEFPSLFFADDESLTDALTITPARIRALKSHAGKARRLFGILLPKIGKHRAEMEACILGADIVLAACRRWHTARKLRRRPSKAAHRKLAREATALAKRLSRFWNRTRFADDPQKITPVDSTRAHLLPRLLAAAQYSCGIAGPG